MGLRYGYRYLVVIVFVFLVTFFLLNFDLFVTSVDVANHINSKPKKPLILLYTPIFDKPRNDLLDGCSFADQCEFTLNKSRMFESDAVIYHGYDLPSEFPIQKAEYYFKNVFFTQENPISVSVYAPQSPHNFFHWIMSYSRASHIQAPYGGYWVDAETAKQQGFPPLKLPFDSETIFAKKSIPGAFWVVSNCKTPSKRENVVAALAEHFRIDIAGKCGTDSNLTSLCSPFPDNCHDIYEKYYFYLSLENAECVDYITEKYWSHFMLPVIPIVMRRYIYENRIPPGSFIAFDDYPNPKAMANYLKSLISNQTAYLKYFKYRQQGWTHAAWNSPGYTIGTCNLCEKLLSIEEKLSPSQIVDVKSYYFDMAPCQRSQFADKWSIQN